MKPSTWPTTTREVGMFYAATVFITWLIWLPALLIRTYGVNVPVSASLLITAGTFTPSLVGLLFAFRFGGRAELRSLLISLLHVRFGASWLALLVLPGVSAVAVLILFLAGEPLPAPQFGLLFIPVAFVFILLFMGPLGEEIGWRGFALKRMLKAAPPLKAAVVLGVLWSIWHTPLFFIDGSTQHALTSFGTGTALLGYTLYTVCISILITLLYIKTGGSVSAAICMHTAANLSLGYMPIIFSLKPAAILLGILCLTTLLILIAHRNTFLFCCNQMEDITPQGYYSE
ncbi:MAG: CPBP family intramembrane glutamic endopeptidase [Spirochaetota bacterium]